ASDFGKNDAMLLKYDASGNEIWGRIFGGADYDFSEEVDCDNAGNVFIVGGFQSSSITFGTFTETGDLFSDIYVAKYNTLGDAQWAFSAGAENTESGRDIMLDATGNVYVFGDFWCNSFDYGGFTLTNANVGPDDWVAKHNNNDGSVEYVAYCGGFSDDKGIAGCVSATGEAWFTGTTRSPDMAFGSFTLTNTADAQIFVAKLGSTVGTEEYEISKGLKVYPNPFKTQATVHFNQQLMNAVITIYNLQGQLVLEKDNVFGPTTKLECNSLPSGVYYLRINDGQKLIGREKLVIE
ncbi:T9SS type A sorting domain-containing protein, partial [Crocinitomix catalasitica]|nr:T9SS type A sorting domain-containing protein [Crocinitomix catalasitica]